MTFDWTLTWANLVPHWWAIKLGIVVSLPIWVATAWLLNKASSSRYPAAATEGREVTDTATTERLGYRPPNAGI